ncbi:MAG: type II toxin-antitoxin system MqsA family antitoxin [Candidatus Marithrix sp.]
MCICYKCNSHDVTQTTELEKNKYQNVEYDIEVDYSLCNSCGREFLNKTQIIINDARTRKAKKKIDGLLSADAIRDIRKKLNLTQADAAIIFGGGKNAFSKYERSEVTQSVAMDKLLCLASEDISIFRRLWISSGMKGEYNLISLVNVPNTSKLEKHDKLAM